MKKLLISLLSLLLTFSLLMPIVAEDNQSNSSTTDSQTSEQTKPEEPSTGDIVWKEGMTVEYDGEQYAKLTEALTAVYKTGPHNQDNPAIINCRENANVGSMTHGHVADSIIINGNGATISEGRGDLEIDTYKFDRNTGNQVSENESDLAGDITIVVNDLNGVGAWGVRRTNHTINLEFNNCQNMSGIYISGYDGIYQGTNNYTLSNCTLGEKAAQTHEQGIAIRSETNGTININNCEFTGLQAPICLLSCVKGGSQNINVSNSKFTDCGIGNGNFIPHAAPMKIFAVSESSTNLSVDNCEFTYTGENKPSNGDVLLGTGEAGWIDQGTVTAEIKNSNINVQKQIPGYYQDDYGSIADSSKMNSYSLTKNDKLTLDASGNVKVEDTQGESSKPDYNWVYRPSYNDSKDEEVKEYTTEDKTKACIELLGKGWEYSEKNKSCVYTLDSSTQQIPNTSTK